MGCDTSYCSFVGQCYADGMEVCGEEITFGNCWVCDGGELEYKPTLLTENYPERL